MKATRTYFDWSDESRQHLIKLVIDSDEKTLKRDWKEVYNNFVLKYPHYEGSSNNLRNMFARLEDKQKNLTHCNENFDWTNEPRQYLVKLMQDYEIKSLKPNWKDILEQFTHKYPKYQGKAVSLNSMASKLKANINFSGNANESIRAQENVSPMATQESLKLDGHKSFILCRLVDEIRVDGYPNWTKIHKRFQKEFTDYVGNKNDLKELYNSVINDMYERHADNPDSEWDNSYTPFLLHAIHQAEVFRAQNPREGMKTITKNVLTFFKSNFKNQLDKHYMGHDFLILKQFYKIIGSRPLSGQCIENIDSMSNFTFKNLFTYSSKNHTLTHCTLFKECCHNCGFIFFKLSSVSNKFMLPKPISDPPNVTNLYGSVPYVFKIDERYITCLECMSNPDWYKTYNVMLSLYKNWTPDVLLNLNEYERNQIALCGGFYKICRNANQHFRVFEHAEGECNIYKKKDLDYSKVFTSYYGVEKPFKTEESNKKIKAALIWLRKNNHLFTTFLSNYETIYGYLMSIKGIRPEERVIQISKGNLNDFVGKESTGLFIPADNVKIDSFIKPSEHKFGVQHPLDTNLHKIRNLISVAYSDEHLEAKRWPHLFPEGVGSWKQKSVLRPLTYVKHRLLSIDSRFRKTNEFMFFWYDRLLKQRLLYYNTRGRNVNVNELLTPLKAKDVKEHQNKYGTVVPSSISGSRTYWGSCKANLLAMVKYLGKPHLFTTLTQNDNWPELQMACGHLTKSELEALDRPIMQPAVHGRSTVNHPVEVVCAFYRRLEMFLKTCIHGNKSPYGKVIDYWIRIEYQQRGALHAHMVIWVEEDTMPENVVMAELPRYAGDDSELQEMSFWAREYVKAFQLHNCISGKCHMPKGGPSLRKCKFGFPYQRNNEEKQSESKMGYLYVRRSDEDKNVVPYNLATLLCWNGHINVQKVTANGLESYLCKYVSKPERSIDLDDSTSDCDRFLKARVVGILECVAHLLQLKQVNSSRKVVYLPCEFKPNFRMLKRKAHLPKEDSSEDLYYNTLLDKYLARPPELNALTYCDLYRFYDVVYEKQKTIPVERESDGFDDCSQAFTQLTLRGRKQYFSFGYKYVEKSKYSIPRWKFLLPCGKDSEKYYEQLLLLNVPISLRELDENGLPFSSENMSKTFTEECCLRNLIDSEAMAKDALVGAIQNGFSINRVIELATLLVDQKYVTRDLADSIVLPWIDSMPCELGEGELYDDDEHGEELNRIVEDRLDFKPFEEYLNQMTKSQGETMDWIELKMSKSQQILAIITGGAGSGKSFITRAIYSYFVEKKMLCILLATTGAAAHLISGTTVHYYLKLDIEGNCYLQAGTISSKIIADTDVIIVDEFSMLTSDLFNKLNECTQKFGAEPQKFFGGKHVIMVGDPSQLPSIGTTVFANPLLNAFSIVVLKECVRQEDSVFANLLNRVRVNELTPSDIEILRERYFPASDVVFDDDTLIVVAKKNKMNMYNTRYINSLPGVAVNIPAQDFEGDNVPVSDYRKQSIKRFCSARWEDNLIIKEGCIVRLLRNIDVRAGWVNGKRARVFRASADGTFVILQDLIEETKTLPLTKMKQTLKLGSSEYYRLQFPLRLGISTTVHSVQGITASGKYYVDLDSEFWESGQAFVALSRPKGLDNLHLLNTHFEKVYIHPYYLGLLKWMSEVDEIALMKKPRIKGDFPLYYKDDKEAEVSNIGHVPTETQIMPLPATLTRPFKAPRKVQNDTCKLTATNRILQTWEKVENRLVLLCTNFNDACRANRCVKNKINFGCKFFDYFLLEVNKKLSIFNISIPESMENPFNDTAREQEILSFTMRLGEVISLFTDLIQKFRESFDLMLEIVQTLEVKTYDRQKTHECISLPVALTNVLKPVSTSPDGRCFYHSMSYNLMGDESLSNALKVLLAYKITQNLSDYDAVYGRLASSGVRNIVKALSYNQWADLELMLGMSMIVRRPIDLYAKFGGVVGMLDNRFNMSKSTRSSISVAYVKANIISPTLNHYIALLYIRSDRMPSPPETNVYMTSPNSTSAIKESSVCKKEDGNTSDESL